MSALEKIEMRSSCNFSVYTGKRQLTTVLKKVERLNLETVTLSEKTFSRFAECENVVML